jgi:PPOX class probable F420-dependent enzyme
MTDDGVLNFIAGHRVGRLATAGGDRQPAVIPVCYAFDGRAIYTPVDEKPKSVDPERLARVRNIRENPRVALVVDDYSEDWTRLAYVLVTGVAEVIEPGAAEHQRAVGLLREKYQQYRSMRIDERLIIKITPVRIKSWDAGGL